ncbi:MAG TPA: hypothetical protein VGR22_05240 [Thermomicrobiales bacterium]|nr:hypothetical protein [Thermomicrobiales bacterium]
MATSVPLADAILQRYRDEGIEVALVLADFRLAGANGITFLAGIRPCHPRARRALLTTLGDHEAATPIHQAMALGQLDLIVSWPWESPEESLYPRVSEALATWWHTNRPAFERVRVIGKQWDPQSHFLRDMGKRNGVPFGFYGADSTVGCHMLREMEAEGLELPVVSIDGKYSPIRRSLTSRTCSAPRRRCPRKSATSPSWAPAPPAWRQPSTPHRKGCGPPSSNRSRSAGRRA